MFCNRQWKEYNVGHKKRTHPSGQHICKLPANHKQKYCYCDCDRGRSLHAYSCTCRTWRDPFEP